MAYVVWLIFALAIVGVVLNIRKSRWGFAAWMVTNSFWCCYNYADGDAAQGTLFAVFWVLSVWGFYSWKKESK